MKCTQELRAFVRLPERNLAWVVFFCLSFSSFFVSEAEEEHSCAIDTNQREYICPSSWLYGAYETVGCEKKQRGAFDAWPEAEEEHELCNRHEPEGILPFALLHGSMVLWSTRERINGELCSGCHEREKKREVKKDGSESGANERKT